MTTATDVANYFLYRANEHGDFISNLKLQKMLYYAQGWYLGEFSVPLFEDEIQAWVHGPIVVSQLNRFQSNRNEPISYEVTNPPEFSPTIKNHLDEIFDIHIPLSGWEMEKATHAEAPWRTARNGLPLDAPSQNIITHESMRDFFSKRLQEHG